MSKSELKKNLADNLRAHRLRSGLSQDAFAAKCGLHRTYIGSLERQERNTTLSTLELIAKAVGVSVPELLTKGGVK